MSTNEQNTTPQVEFSTVKKFVLSLAIVWNLLGVLAFIGQVTMTPESMAELPQEQQNLYMSIPVWATAAFAIAVFGGTIGSALLFLRKSLATNVLLLSLMGISVQMFHSFFISNSFEVFGPGGLVMPIMVVVIAIALLLHSKKLEAAGQLT